MTATRTVRAASEPRQRRAIIDGGDVLGLVGLVLLAAGLWLWWPPAALIVTGSILLGVAVVGALVRTMGRGSDADYTT